MRLTRRRVLAGMLAAAAGVAAGLTAASASAPGMPQVPCRRIGQRVVVDGVSYVCVRRQGRLQWARRGPAPTAPQPTPSHSATTAPGTTPSATPSAGPTVPPGPVGAVATLSALPDGRDVILGTRDAGGLPVDVVLRRSGDAVRAFDARCTHAGCVVAVDGTDLLCRCHGSVFDGATGARVAGPAPSGLLALPVRISGGQVFVTVT